MPMPTQPTFLSGIVFKITQPDGTEVSLGHTAAQALEAAELADRLETFPVMRTDPDTGEEYATRISQGHIIEVEDDVGMTNAHVGLLKAAAQARGSLALEALCDAVVAGGTAEERKLVAMRALEEWREADRDAIQSHLESL